jgi:hypothetical protein
LGTPILWRVPHMKTRRTLEISRDKFWDMLRWFIRFYLACESVLGCFMRMWVSGVKNWTSWSSVLLGLF